METGGYLSLIDEKSILKIEISKINGKIKGVGVKIWRVLKTNR